MAGRESNGVDDLFGGPRKARGCQIIGAELQRAQRQHEAAAVAAWISREFEYHTLPAAGLVIAMRRYRRTPLDLAPESADGPLSTYGHHRRKAGEQCK
jgi:ferric-dicitrate binding protein FerR (iron transport regulator)